MDIGQAISCLRNGEKVRRRGWNGKGMFLVYVPATPDAFLRDPSPYAGALHPRNRITIDAHIDMYTAGGTMQPGWLASQADLLADDWEVAI